MNGFYNVMMADFYRKGLQAIHGVADCFGAESMQTWVINQKPADWLISIGDGNFLRGVAWLKAKVNGLKKPWHNCMMLAASETVGAAATFSIRFKIWQPFLLNAVQYKNSANDTGALTSIKVNGELITPRGLTTEDTLANFDITDTFGLDNVDFLFVLPAGSEIEFNGTATQNDVVTIAMVGYDLDMQRVD